MLKEKIIRICDKIIEALIVGVIFLIPLYFNIFVYLNFEKFILFRCLVEILVFIYFCRVFLGGKLVLIRNKYFYLSLLFILSSQILATIFSSHPYISFWGSYFRNFGLFAWIHILAFAYLVFLYLEEKKIRIVFYWISIAAFISSLYAIIQSAGFDFLLWEGVADNFQARVGGTLGQPNYLGAYLLLVLPVTFYLFIFSKTFFKRILFLVILLAQFWALILTYSRAAWVGLILAAAIFLFFYFFKKNRKVFIGAVSLAIISIGFLIYVNTSQAPGDIKNEQLTFLNRARSIIDFKEGSAGIRVLYYQAAIKIIKDRPVMGHGLENQAYYFAKYYNPAYAIYEVINSYPDRAHNEILDILITTGLLGLTAWAFLFFALVKSSLRFLNDENGDRQKKILILTLLFGILSLWISILFGFFTDVLVVYFWVYTVILFKSTSDNARKELEFSIKPYLKYILLAVFLACIASLAMETNIKPTMADYYYRQGKKKMLKNEFNQALDNFNKVIEYAPRASYYRSQISVEMLPVALNIFNKDQKFKLLNDLKLTLEDQNLGDVAFEARAYLGIILSEIGKIKLDRGEDVNNIEEFKEADKLFFQIVKEVPNMARPYLDYGNLFFYEKKYGEALDKYYKALSLYPDLSNPSINQEHRGYIINEKIKVYKKIIEINIIKGDYKNAIKFTDEALKLDPRDLELWDKIDLAYLNLGETDILINYLKHLIALYPQNDQIYYQLAMIYKNKGDKVEARNSIKKAIEINSQEKKYQEFLIKLK